MNLTTKKSLNYTCQLVRKVARAAVVCIVFMMVFIVFHYITAGFDQFPGEVQVWGNLRLDLIPGHRSPEYL